MGSLRVIARALTIAGSDPSGGAGVQQDLRTFAALGVWGASVITAITVQDTTRVYSWEAVDAGVIASQLDVVLEDLQPTATKTGMLPTADVVTAVAKAVTDHRIDALVVDPVGVATSGDALQTDDAFDALRAELIPRALVVTPNTDEATRLTGIAVTDRKTMLDAARALLTMGPRAVYLKGGHLGTGTDLFATHGGEEWPEAAWVDAEPIHGTGCVLSAALTALLARGVEFTEAATRAKRLVARAIADRIQIGSGAAVLIPRAEVEG
jgi:hydroxymethylpyrimidine/phosphomethylpyrimidine kinase